MNSMMIKIVVVAMGMFHIAAFAASDKGNGGGAVVCREPGGKVTSIKVLDIYEAELRKINLDFGPSPATIQQIVTSVLDRLKQRDQLRAGSYLSQAAKFFDPENSEFLTGITLPFSEDTGPFFPPTGCGLEQVILQREPQIPSDRLYTINKDLWDLLDVKNQAALVLHEIIYHELKANQTTSYLTRFFNENLLSSTFATLGIYDFTQLLIQCGFTTTSLDGFTFDPKKIEFLPDHTLSGGKLAPCNDGTPTSVPTPCQNITINNNTFLVKGILSFNSTTGKVSGFSTAASYIFQFTDPSLGDCYDSFEGPAYITLTDDGNDIAKINSNSPLTLCTLQNSGEYVDQKFYGASGAIFYPGLKPSVVTASETVFLPVFQNVVPFISTIYFNEDGHVNGGVLAEDVDLMGSDGILHHCKKRANLIQFDDSGKVTNYCGG